MTTDGIIFDMDGTLWDSRQAVRDSWNMVFERLGLERRIGVEELTGYMGLPMDEFGRRMFPDWKDEEITPVMNQCYEAENSWLAETGALLYPGLEETLRILNERTRLFIISNCQSGYIEAFFKAHGLGKYVTAYTCFGDTGLLKDANIRQLAAEYGIERPVYVGDTQGDADATHAAGAEFIFAAYGFGDVKEPELVIRNLYELTELF